MISTTFLTWLTNNNYSKQQNFKGWKIVDTTNNNASCLHSTYNFPIYQPNKFLVVSCVVHTHTLDYLSRFYKL